MHDAQPADPRDSYAMQIAARAHRSRILGDLLASALRALVGHFRAWRERQRHHADARAIHRELAGLDSHTLRDLGIHHRGELKFIAQRLADGEDLRPAARPPLPSARGGSMPPERDRPRPYTVAVAPHL